MRAVRRCIVVNEVPSTVDANGAFHGGVQLVFEAFLQIKIACYVLFERDNRSNALRSNARPHIHFRRVTLALHGARRRECLASVSLHPHESIIRRTVFQCKSEWSAAAIDFGVRLIFLIARASTRVFATNCALLASAACANAMNARRYGSTRVRSGRNGDGVSM